MSTSLGTQILPTPGKETLFQLPNDRNVIHLDLLASSSSRFFIDPSLEHGNNNNAAVAAATATTTATTALQSDVNTLLESSDPTSSISNNFSLLTTNTPSISSTSIITTTTGIKNNRPYDDTATHDNESNYNRKRAKITCTHPGCDRSFNRPAKLQEHLVSHEGKRPFICDFEGCDASFVREVNLQTHQRTHKPMEERPLVCTAEGCDKRFWTAQHLRRHVEQAHGGLKCPYCVQTFKKHFQLRAHALAEHAIDEQKIKKDPKQDELECDNTTTNNNQEEHIVPKYSSGEEATSTAILLPYECTQEGCGKRFQSRAKLRAHAKRHDTNRYACFHSKCIENGAAPHFQTWTALQNHHKTVHPPICPHAECNGRKFQREDQLRNHLRTHTEGRQLRKPRVQRTSWLCPVDGCEEEFQLQPHLRKHLADLHPEFEETEETQFAKVKTVRIPCTHADGGGCTFHARTMALLETHMENVHGEKLLDDTRREMTEQQGGGMVMMTNELTGTAMLETWQGRTIQCPWMTSTTSNEENMDMGNAATVPARCKHWFKRVYDLQRHLAHIHKLTIESDDLKKWLQDLQDGDGINDTVGEAGEEL